MESEDEGNAAELSPELGRQIDKSVADPVAAFMDITGCNKSLSKEMITSHDNNLEAALNAFYGSDSSNQPVVKDESSDEAVDPASLEGLEVSLVSWNIDGLDGNSIATRMKAVYMILKRINADFVFLQEVVSREIDTIKKLESFYKIYFSEIGNHYFTAILVSKMFDVEKHEVIHFANSGMGRTLQIVEGRLGHLKVFLLNTHLESTAEHSKIRCEQYKQCMDKIRELTTRYPHCLLYFGGDLNLRDFEVEQQASSIPPGVADAWLAAGADNKEKYTFDMRQNDNKELRGARCRFDRIYFYGPLRISSFELDGKQRIRTTLCFPSDHWAVSCIFKA